MHGASPIDRVVGQARRRMIILLAADEFFRASSIVCLLLAVMLIAGAGVFRPAWPGAAMGVAAAWTVWRVRCRAPDHYTAAQRADSGLGLRDLLATAWHLRHSGRGNPSPLAPVVERSAAEACGGADAGLAIPFRWTRSAVIALAAVSLLLALFVIRVGLLRSFDLRPPLVAVQFDTLTGAPVPPEPARRPPAKKLDLPGFSLEDARAGALDEEQLPMEALRTAESGDSSTPSPQGNRAPTGRMQTPGQSGESGQEQTAEEAAGDAADAGQDSGQQQNGKEPPQRAQPQDSLLDKMRDALASLMDKFKLEMPPGDGTRSAKQSAKQEAARREKGRPQPGKKGEQGQEGDMLSGQQQAQSDAAQQAKSEQAGSPDAASQNEKSGIGKEEGRKQIEAAEELQAMGKLDELLGKRAQNVQGEVMVEVTNSKNQQLRTPFTGRTGVRTDAGSELGRDEVPLHLQEYVQRYYEQVRRQAPQNRQ
jgi:hypothetical protein